MKTIQFRNQVVPDYICFGNMTRFIAPVAQEVCNGVGLDVGCGRKEWVLPGAIPVDVKMEGTGNAIQIPQTPTGWDYIFSSHMLEHVDDYMAVLRHWFDSLRPGGLIFLYLPHPDCLYWRPHLMPTMRHRHQFDPEQMGEILRSLPLHNVFVSGRDAAWSFCAYGQRP